MQFSTIALTVTFAALSSATVFTGTLTLPAGDKQAVAWTNGEIDPCSQFTLIGSGDAQTCNEVFSAGGVGGFELKGCGGNGLTLFKDGEFNSNCAFDPKEIPGCPDSGAKLEQTFSCF